MIFYEPNVNEVKDSFRNFVLDILQLDRVLWAEQRKGKPERPCCVLNVVSVKIESENSEKLVDESGDSIVVTTVQDYQIFFSVNIMTEANIDEDAFFYMQKLSQSVTMNYAYERFRNEGLSLIEKSDIRNLSSQYGNVWEKRAQQDYFFRYRARTREDIDSIDTIEITGTVIDDQDNETEDTIEIDNN